MFKKNKIISSLLMLVLGMNGFNNFTYASEKDNKQKVDSVKLNNIVPDAKKNKNNTGNSTFLKNTNFTKFVPYALGLAISSVPVVTVILKVKSQAQLNKMHELSKEIDNYRRICPNMAKLLDDYTDSVSKCRMWRGKGETKQKLENERKENLKKISEYNGPEKEFFIPFDGTALTLFDAYGKLGELGSSSATTGNWAFRLELANEILKTFRNGA